MKMIERVARALCAVDCRNPDEKNWAHEPIWESYTKEARAAIKAMRRQTPGEGRALND